jgi:DNA-directed RNA polymerase delta subunit
MFLGMSIPDAARKLLAMRKRTMGNVEIARELRDGGMVLKSKDPVNVVGSVLTRRFNDVGDVVKVGRGIWGLKEWYPGRNFKTIGKGNIVMVTPSADGMSETGEQVREGDEPPLDHTDAVQSRQVRGNGRRGPNRRRLLGPAAQRWHRATSVVGRWAALDGAQQA